MALKVGDKVRHLNAGGNTSFAQGVVVSADSNVCVVNWPNIGKVVHHCRFLIRLWDKEKFESLKEDV